MGVGGEEKNFFHEKKAETSASVYCLPPREPPLSSEALREGGSTFQKKRGILLRE